MASSGTKLPAIPPIPSNTDPQLKTYLNAVDEALKVRLGTVGDPKDRAITVRELIDSGLAENFLEEPFNPNAGTPSTTFVPIGGHNLIEAAQFSKSIIIGPYYNKIKEIVELFKKNNAVIISNNISDLYLMLFNIFNKRSLLCPIHL